MSHPELENNKIITTNPNRSSETITVTGVKVGQSVVTFSGTASKGSGEETFNPVSITINVTEVTPPPSTGGNTQKPKPPVKDDTEGEKGGTVQTEEQKKKAEEERKKQELEALKKVPLVKEISITSDAEKMNGDVLTTINLVDNTFDYSYKLPRKIDKVKVSVAEVEGVTLTYDKDVTFGVEEESKRIQVKAVKGEVDQTFNITILHDITPDTVREVQGKSATVYQDERVSHYLDTLGLKTVTPENSEVGSVFEDGNLRLQLLVNEKEEANFYLLDETYQVVEPVSVVLSADSHIIAVQSSNEITDATLYGSKQIKAEHAAVLTLEEIDPTLNMSKETTYWDIEEGAVFYGSTASHSEETFILNQDLHISKVVVAFDKINSNQSNLIIGLSVALGTLVATNVVYIFTHFIKKRKYS